MFVTTAGILTLTLILAKSQTWPVALTLKFAPNAYQALPCITRSMLGEVNVVSEKPISSVQPSNPDAT